MEEQQEGNDAESHRREIELLKEEGMLPLDQLLSTLKLPQVASANATGPRWLSNSRKALNSVLSWTIVTSSYLNIYTLDLT